MKSGRQHQVQTMLIMTKEKLHEMLCPLPGVTGFFFLIIQSAVSAGWLQPTESPEETQ